MALVAITAGGARYVRARCGVEAFALLIDKLPAEELEALAAASTALEQLLQLDEKQRDSASCRRTAPSGRGPS